MERSTCLSRILNGVRADIPLSYEKLEYLAARLRPALKYEARQAICGKKLFEDLDGMRLGSLCHSGTTANIPITTGVSEITTEGLTRYNQERQIIEILLSEQTYRNLMQGVPRAQFALLHELAHAILHTDQLLRLSELPTSSQAAFHRGGKANHHPAYLDTEWQANGLAAALYMPAAGIAALEIENSGTLHLVASVMEEYGASFEAASNRLEVYEKYKKLLL